MTGDPCAPARVWMAQQQVGGETRIADAARSAAHVATCDLCRSVLQDYERLSAATLEWSTYHPSDAVLIEWISDVCAAQEAGLFPKERVHQALEYSPTTDDEQRFVAHMHTQFRETKTEQGSRFIRIWGPLLALAASLLLGVWVATGSDRNSRPSQPVSVASVDEVSVARIDTIRGAVVVNGRSALDGMLVQEGAAIRTPAGGQLAFSQLQNASVTVYGSSSLTVSQWQPKHTILVLEEGTVFSEVQKGISGRRYEIETPDARIVVVGTSFSVTYQSGDGTTVRGMSGTVRVETLQGRFLGLVQGGEVLRSQVARRNDEASTSREVSPEPNAVSKAPKPVYPPLEQARTWIAQGQEKEAIRLLNTIEQPTWQKDALLGDAHSLLGDVSAAKSAYTTALIRADVPPESLFVDLAGLIDQEGSDDDALVQVWEKYLAVYPKGYAAPRALLTLGQVAHRAENWTTAQAQYMQVLTQYPQSSESDTAFMHLGRRLIDSGLWTDAHTFFSTSWGESTYRHEASMVGLIRVSIGQNDVSAAEATLTHYEEQFPNGVLKGDVIRLREALQ